MKRYPAVIGATVAGVAGILSFHTTNGSQPLSGGLAVGSKTGGTSTTTTTTSPATTAPPGGSNGTTTTTPSTSSPPTTTVRSPATATGASEQYGYGVLSVKVTIQGTKIVDVQLASLQTAETYSQQLAQQVVPYLRRQVLSAQSARIYGVSGATYTSEAYLQSVQSALDQLHFK